MLPPFLFPPMLPGGIGGAIPPGGEQIEEIVRTKDDGSVCTTTLVWDDSHKLLRNATKCRDPPSEATPSRRLQLMLPGMLPGVAPPPDNTWVLGGVFLENFVVILDYENKRLGFAEPLHTYDYGATAETFGAGGDSYTERDTLPEHQQSYRHPYHDETEEMEPETDRVPPPQQPVLPQPHHQPDFPPPQQPSLRPPQYPDLPQPYHHDGNEADSRLDRAPVLRPNAILQPRVQETRMSGDTSQSSFPWGLTVFGIILLSLVAGAYTLFRKITSRKILLRDQAGGAEDLGLSVRGGGGGGEYDPEDTNAAE